MNVNDFDLKKTALLFFDILNGYVPEPEPGKPRVSETMDSKCRQAQQSRPRRRSAGVFRQGQSSPGRRDQRGDPNRHQ